MDKEVLFKKFVVFHLVNRHLLWNQKIYYHVLKMSPAVTVLIHMDSIPIVIPRDPCNSSVIGGENKYPHIMYRYKKKEEWRNIVRIGVSSKLSVWYSNGLRRLIHKVQDQYDAVHVVLCG
jgi:hypothetical protein